MDYNIEAEFEDLVKRQEEADKIKSANDAIRRYKIAADLSLSASNIKDCAASPLLYNKEFYSELAIEHIVELEIHIERLRQLIGAPRQPIIMDCIKFLKASLDCSPTETQEVKKNEDDQLNPDWIEKDC